MNARQLANALKNIGPVMADKLINAGIDTPKKLQKLGAKKAFLRIFKSGGFCGKFHPAYLYALEGAIADCHWHDIAPALKKEYKTFCLILRNKHNV